MDRPADVRRHDKRSGRYRLTIVTRPGAGLGFRLAGVRVEEVAEAHAAERVAALLKEPDQGILAVEDDLLRHVAAALLERAAQDGVPVVLSFTLSRRWEEGGGGEAYVAALIRRAIGYHIKIDA